MLIVNKNRGAKATPNPLGTKEVYALTLSSNYAKEKNSKKTYKYIIKQFPTGTYKYTYELSKYGKYHVHGIMQFKYKFDYVNLMQSKNTVENYQYDVHIRYDKITDTDNLDYWSSYANKQGNKIRTHNCDSSQTKITNIPDTCIPQVIKKVIYKKMTIPGL